jgi:hypothetical protein
MLRDEVGIFTGDGRRDATQYANDKLEAAPRLAPVRNNDDAFVVNRRRDAIHRRELYG